MTEILNPIYDASFKFLMEDARAAKALLSALLRRKVTDITPMAHEHYDKVRDREAGKDLGIYRLDYTASIETAEGGNESVCIELQKVWFETEIYRFRKYLGGQHADPNNMETGTQTPRHIIAIYILGHTISETDSPIAYGFGGHLTDYYGQPLELSNTHGGYGNGKFVRCLTHDIIIVQVPRLPDKPRNAAERVLAMFDQRRLSATDKHVIELPDDCNYDDDPLSHRLRMGLGDKELREKMDIEMEILTELELRSAELRESKEIIEKQQREIEQSKREVEQSKREVEQSKREVEQSRQEIERRTRASVAALSKAGMDIKTIAATLGLDEGYVGEMVE